MTGQDTATDRIDVLDFPGADRLQAAGRVAPPSADAVAAALAAVRSAAGQEQGGTAGAAVVVELDARPVTEPGSVRAWRRGLPLLVAAAVAATIAVGVAFPPWSDSETSRTSPAAEPTATAPYWKVRTLQWSRSASGNRQPDATSETLWVSRDGTRGKPGNHPVQDYSRRDMGGTAYVICGRPISWDDLKKLPTDPSALRAHLVGKATGASVTEDLYNGIEELLTRSPAEPRLRAALFTVLTRLPGARVTEEVKDSTGRVGTAVAIDVDTWHRQLVVDTKAHHVLEATDTARNNGLTWGDRQLRAGDLLQRTTYVSVGPAWQAPEVDPVTKPS
ncbi:hypothetical protein AAHZ94_17885 [Streptomyces sp. HSW2009]|uniref:hypothetical protein n=1 Tax=Streptomyces sp. HSW2009 TaxID=3142890 RepID=UPI0032EEED6C